jgi:DNA-binding CsgD family transcriptional regulator
MICAMPPLTLLTFLVALATGFISLAWMSRRSHHHYSPVTESLISPMLYYNLWILTWLIRNYVEPTLLGSLTPNLERLLVMGLIWISMLAAILWGSSYLSFTLRATHSTHPQDMLRHIQKGVFLLVGATAITCMVLVILRLDPWIRVFSRGLSSLIFLTVALLSLRLFYTAHRRGDETSWRKLKLLGATYSALFVMLTTLVWWHRVSPMSSRYTFLTINVGFEILYNLVTVLWIQVFDRTLPEHETTPSDSAPLRPSGQTFTTGFAISKRELEVIQLICRGLTNQEIADTLFISLKTVKDHNYHIFQKTGVRNRVELVQLARKNPGTEQAG